MSEDNSRNIAKRWNRRLFAVGFPSIALTFLGMAKADRATNYSYGLELTPEMTEVRKEYSGLTREITRLEEHIGHLSFFPLYERIEDDPRLSEVYDTSMETILEGREGLRGLLYELEEERDELVESDDTGYFLAREEANAKRKKDALTWGGAGIGGLVLFLGGIFYIEGRQRKELQALEGTS